MPSQLTAKSGQPAPASALKGILRSIGGCCNTFERTSGTFVVTCQDVAALLDHHEERERLIGEYEEILSLLDGVGQAGWRAFDTLTRLEANQAIVPPVPDKVTPNAIFSAPPKVPPLSAGRFFNRLNDLNRFKSSQKSALRKAKDVFGSLRHVAPLLRGLFERLVEADMTPEDANVLRKLTPSIEVLRLTVRRSIYCCEWIRVEPRQWLNAAARFYPDLYFRTHGKLHP